MEQAKNTISSFLGRSGHETEVHEQVNPAVTSETVKPHRHEETTQAIDKEIHQDHYHTTVQPISHQEVLPEQHTHQQAPVQEREFHHGDREQDRAGVESQLGQFQDSSTTHDTQHHTSAGQTEVGEHVHHHVHENVQPIIHKETVQPSVVHTTVPIHEKHHAPSEHHGLSTLPEKSMSEIQSSGVPLGGTESTHREYEGHPRPYNSEFQTERKPVDIDPRAHEGVHDLSATGHSSSGPHSSDTGNKLDPRVDSDRDGSGFSGPGATSGTFGSGTGHSSTGFSGPEGTSGTFGSGTGSAPSETGQFGRSQDYSSGTTGTTGHGANPEAMGSGIAGVGAGAAASDLGRDHTRAGQNTGLSDVDARHGESGLGSTGTALGGRTGGNTTDYANESSTGSYRPEGDSTTHDTTTTGGTHHHGTESSNLSQSHTSGTERGIDSTRGVEHETVSGEQGHKHHLPGTHKSGTDSHSTGVIDDGRQHGSQGKDPALEGDSSKSKLTGSGADGSHSAVFGLTPDGHKYNDTQHHTTAPHPVEGESGSGEAVGGGTYSEETGSRGGRSGIAEQLHDPNVANKAHGGPNPTSEGDSTKAGSGFTPGQHGTGTVKPGEHNSGPATADKMNPRTDADGDGKAGVMD